MSSISFFVTSSAAPYSPYPALLTITSTLVCFLNAFSTTLLDVYESDISKTSYSNWLGYVS